MLQVQRRRARGERGGRGGRQRRQAARTLRRTSRSPSRARAARRRPRRREHGHARAGVAERAGEVRRLRGHAGPAAVTLARRRKGADESDVRRCAWYPWPPCARRPGRRGARSQQGPTAQRRAHAPRLSATAPARASPPGRPRPSASRRLPPALARGGEQIDVEQQVARGQPAAARRDTTCDAGPSPRTACRGTAGPSARARCHANRRRDAARERPAGRQHRARVAARGDRALHRGRPQPRGAAARAAAWRSRRRRSRPGRRRSAGRWRRSLRPCRAWDSCRRVPAGPLGRAPRRSAAWRRCTSRAPRGTGRPDGGRRRDRRAMCGRSVPPVMRGHHDVETQGNLPGSGSGRARTCLSAPRPGAAGAPKLHLRRPARIVSPWAEGQTTDDHRESCTCVTRGTRARRHVTGVAAVSADRPSNMGPCGRMAHCSVFGRDVLSAPGPWPSLPSYSSSSLPTRTTAA